MPNSTQVASVTGVVGFFDDSRSLVSAAQKLKDSPFREVDAFTPYPVHGLDAALGVKRSKIGIVTFIAGVTGCICAFSLEYWTSAVDWPLNVAGKPVNSWPAFVPIMFELTILFAGLSTLAALIFFCRLPNFKRVVDPSVTRDRFALLIEAPVKSYQPFNEQSAKDVLKKAGAKDVRTVYAEGWFQ